MNLITMRYFVRKLGLVNLIRLDCGFFKAVGIVIQSSFAPNKFLVIGPNAHQKLLNSLHKQYLKNISLKIHPLSLWTKPMRLPVHCSCHRSVVSVRKSYTTTSKQTRKLMYSFSQLRPFVLHHGTYIPCLSTWESTLTSKIGETSISTSINHDICRAPDTSLDRAGRR